MLNAAGTREGPGGFVLGNRERHERTRKSGRASVSFLSLHFAAFVVQKRAGIQVALVTVGGLRGNGRTSPPRRNAMQPHLEKLTIRGFRSIRAMEGLSMGRMNVLIGGNGAGKSNLVSALEVFSRHGRGNLALAERLILEGGGVDSFLHFGPKLTQRIEISGRLGLFRRGFAFSILPSPDNTPILGDILCGSPEFVSDPLKRAQAELGNSDGISALECEDDSTFSLLLNPLCWPRVYHFHDTTPIAAIRRAGPVYDAEELRGDGGNLSAFLLRLKNEDPDSFGTILSAVQLVAPFIERFDLTPKVYGPEEKVALHWRQKGSDFPFRVWHLSDGTLRFIALMTALLQPNPPSMIVIDEPELGLHPFALSVLASHLELAAERTQVLVCTQSPTLLNHFDPEDVIVVDRVQGASEFRRLDGDSLKKWLEDYSLGDLWQKNVLDGGPVYEAGPRSI